MPEGEKCITSAKTGGGGGGGGGGGARFSSESEGDESVTLTLFGDEGIFMSKFVEEAAGDENVLGAFEVEISDMSVRLPAEALESLILEECESTKE